MSSNPTETQAAASVLPKACENCRVRKIRCNKASPTCSNCETSGIICRPATKTTEQRSRVLLSANYEKQIEQINYRLSGIEDALQNLKINKAVVSPAVTLPDVTASAATSISEVGKSNVQSPAAFEGASSFTSQAIRATLAAETSLEGMQGSAEVIDALASLKKIVKTPGTAGIRQEMRLGASPMPRSLPDMQLLPTQFVLSLLFEFRHRHSALFLAYGFREYKSLERLCQQVYFPTEPVPLASLTLMHGMLFCMVKEMLFEGSYGQCKDYDVRAYCDQCERNFHLGVESYEILACPSLDSAKVLMLAMLKAQEEGKPLLTWTFSSTGARQCISLGFHRKSSMKNDPFRLAEDKRQVFWAYYSVDKNLSLNLGYSSVLQDYDIDVEFFSCSSDPGIRPWDQAALAMIEVSRLQGLVYERLYSLQALNSSAETKANVVDDLSSRLEKWHQEWSTFNADLAYMAALFFLVYGAFDVVYYSVLTTVHRAATPAGYSAEITSACYEAAKRSLQAHLHFFPAFKSYGDAEVLASYVSWILLYASWTPLIVVFLHAIASSSKEDVKLLEETQESLEPIKHLNQQSEQVYALCRIFCKLAKAFVDRNSSNQFGVYNSEEDTVLLPPLNAHAGGADQNFLAAFPSNMQTWRSAQRMGADFPVSGFDASEMDGMSIFLGNWYGANQPVGNLWNMDFTENFEQ